MTANSKHIKDDEDIIRGRYNFIILMAAIGVVAGSIGNVIGWDFAQGMTSLGVAILTFHVIENRKVFFKFSYDKLEIVPENFDRLTRVYGDDSLSLWKTVQEIDGSFYVDVPKWKK